MLNNELFPGGEYVAFIKGTMSSLEVFYPPAICRRIHLQLQRHSMVVLLRRDNLFAAGDASAGDRVDDTGHFPLFIGGALHFRQVNELHQLYVSC